MGIPVKRQLLKSNLRSKRRGYYAKYIKPKQTKTLTDVLLFSQKGSTLDYREAEAAFKMSIDGIIEFLQQGFPINIDDLGTFTPKVSSPMVDDPDDLNQKNIKIDISFTPSEKIMEALLSAGIEFKN